MTSRLIAAAGSAVILLHASTALAQARSAPPAPTPGMQAVFDCQAVPDSAARLACFEQTVAKLKAAFAAREVVVLDRDQARKARREAFGFSLPSLRLLGGGDRDDPSDERVTFTIAAASRSADGKWVIRMTEGAVWKQIDTTSAEPRKGAKAEIRKGALGSYFMKLDSRRAVRVVRER